MAIKTISKKKFLVNERAVTTTRVRHSRQRPFPCHSCFEWAAFDMPVWSQREIDIMKKLSSMDTAHPHIVKLYAVIETSENVYIVMELVQGGELFDHVVERGAYS